MSEEAMSSDVAKNQVQGPQNDENPDKENHTPDEESSPPSPKIRKLSRRSSIAVARRMSRASAAVSGGSGGLPLADQLSLVPLSAEAAPADRLRQIVNICVRTTCRTIEAEERESGEKEDAARSVSRALIDGGCIFPQDTLEVLATRLQESDNIKGSPENLLSGKAREMADYTKKLEDEAKHWKQFLIDRNKTTKVEMNNLKEVKIGAIKVEDTQFYQLSSNDKKFFRQLPKIEDIVRLGQEFERNQTILAERMAFKSNRLRAHLTAISDELSATTRELKAQVFSSDPGEGGGPGHKDILDLLNIQSENQPGSSKLSAESA